MPIPNSSSAVVEDVKVREYLLNLRHPDGGSKAKWFHSLGYNLEAWHDLTTDLLIVARECWDFDTETTRFGVEYGAWGAVGRPGYRPGLVINVWIVESNEPPRLVTAYPGEKR